MASWKSSQGQKVPGKGYTRAEALGRSQLGMFRDLGRDLRDQSSTWEGPQGSCGRPGPDRGSSRDAGSSVDFLSPGRVLSKGAM